MIKKTFTFLTIFLITHFVSFAQVPDTVVKWTFPTGTAIDSIANGGITANLNKVINTVGGTSALYFTTAGASTKSAGTTGWDNGSGVKYWQVMFTTTGYDSLNFYSKQRSSSTGPKNFKVQYRIGINGAWTDLPKDTTNNAANWTSAKLSDLLPVTCNNKDSVYLRWIMTDNVSVGGATVASGGTSNIDDIIICGHNILGNPIVNNAYVKNLSEVVVAFNKPMNNTVDTTSNYTGLGVISSATRNSTKDTVTLNLGTPLINGNAYTLTVSNVQDTNNTTIAKPQLFDFLYNNSIAPIVITEIMYNPPESGTDSLEFVEFYNNSNSVALVGGYEFLAGSPLPTLYYTFPAGTTIDPNKYIVIARNPSIINNFFNITGTLQWASGQALNNAGEKLQITNTVGENIDSLTYKATSPWPISPDGKGSSLTLCNPDLDNSLASSWQASAEIASLDSINHKIVMATPGTGCVNTGISNNYVKNNTVNCFPNPVKESLTISLNEQASNIEIYDILGNNIYKTTKSSLNTRVNTENFMKGIYFIKIIFNNNSVITKKITVM